MRFSRVLGREGADSQMTGMFYITMVQAVLIYGSKKWVMSPHIGKMLGGSHHRFACRLTGGQTKRKLDGMWDNPALLEAMEEAGIQELETYVTHHHNTATQFIETSTIMDLCLEAERHPGARVSNQC